LEPTPSCSCEDFQLRQQPRQHVIAARLVRARDYHGADPKIVTDAVPKRPTYKQGWPLYDLAQTTEKDRFQELPFDLTRGLPDPPRAKTGRKPMTTADLVFAAALKVYSTSSARRFGGDLKDASEEGYLSHLMNPRGTNTSLESPELPPVSHDLIARSSLPLRTAQTAFAPDSTGFSTSRVVRRFAEKDGAQRSGHDRVKAHAIRGVTTNAVTAAVLPGRGAGDAPPFQPPVAATAAAGLTVKEVPADKAYLSHDNLELVGRLGGTACVPLQVNSAPGAAGTLWERLCYFSSCHREGFPKH
jgi:hypothetical protein